MTRQQHETSRDRQGGIALYAALVAMVVVGTTIGLVTQITHRVPRETLTESSRAVALAAADGGIELARARLARQADFAGAATIIGECSVTVTVERLGRAQWRVVSIGRLQRRDAGGLSVSRSVECELVGSAGLPAVSAWRAR